MTSLLSAPLEGAPLDAAPLAVAPLAGALLDAADDDLDALADRLHDGVLQALVAARYACDAVSRGAHPAVARDAVQAALVALRGEVWHLRPRVGQDQAVALAVALAEALEGLSGQLRGAGGAGLRLRLAAVRLHPGSAAVAYRLVQELARSRTDVLDVRLGADGVLELDAPLTDPTTWSMRAAAVGAALVASTTNTRLRLPIDEDPS